MIPTNCLTYSDPRSIGQNHRAELLAAICEFERELIRERTSLGRERAKRNGVKFGRKRKLSDYQRAEAVRRRAAGVESIANILQKSYGVDASMVSRLELSRGG